FGFLSSTLAGTMTTLVRGERLREIRESRGLTQRQLAEICHIGINQLHRYENGKTEPSATTLALIARALNVTTDYLLGLSSDSQGRLVKSDLDDNELDVVNAYRRDGWIGIIRLGTDRIAK